MTTGVSDLPEPHLLVVDDDTRLAELLRRYLSDGGFRVTIAADASEARAQLTSFAFDLFRGDELVHLTAAETGLLSVLAQRAGRPISREELSLCGVFSGNVRNVDVQITRLRRKIERDPRFPRYLQTVRGTGYALKPD